MRSLSKQMVGTVASSAVVLVINLATGIVVARKLGPAGRGELAALFTLVQLLGWIMTFGFHDGMTFILARRPDDAPRTIGTAAVLTLFFGTLAFVAVELMLPYVIAAQRPELLVIGRLYVASIYAHIAFTATNSLIAGRQDFDTLSIARILQPALSLLFLLGLVALGRLTLIPVLVVSIAAIVVTELWAVSRLLRDTRVGRPSTAILKEAMRFGIRTHGSLIAGLGNSRLDLLVIPSILASEQVGLYSVATNTSFTVVSIVGALDIVLFPAATARGHREGLVLVARTLRLALFIGILVSLPLFALAPWLLSLVYGTQYADAALALRILIPGSLFVIGSTLLSGGLHSLNRALAASMVQVAAFVLTVVGLVLTLRRYGIVGAAITSTVCYAFTFVGMLWCLRREEHFSVRECLSVRELLRDLGGLRHRLTPAPEGHDQ